jgi:hypothetical protein
MSNFSINDDKGNPIIGPARVEGKAGLTKGDTEKKEYPRGFTPPLDFIKFPKTIDPKTGLATEYGDHPAQKRPENTDPKTTNDKLKERLDNYDYFNDKSTKGFIHILDTLKGGKGRPIPPPDVKIKDITLGSFIQSIDDNEDPTIYGYDITINYETSPLFNGAIEEFINKNSKYSEIFSRLPVVESFKDALFNFFRNDSPLTTQSNGKDDRGNLPRVIKNHLNPKTYYLKGISGLDKLIETTEKSFIDYRKDVIGLSLYEDVTMNMGYIAMLYKTLTWSKLHGKELIPQNLLRFDAEITITEIRKYNKLIKNSDSSVRVYDLLSKYIYKLYECQFFFPKLPHGDSIDMTAPTIIDKYDISFDYKFSTLKMVKFDFNGSNPSQKDIDNSKTDLSVTKPSDSNSADLTSGISILQNVVTIRPYKTIYGDNNFTNIIETGNDLKSVKEIEKKSSLSQNLNKLKRDLIAAGAHELNRQITQQARLLNKTIDNIRNSTGLGRMSSPTNVYNQNPLKSDIQNALRNFAGKSIKGFFTP